MRRAEYATTYLSCYVVAGAEQRQLVDDILELTHISGPAVAQQCTSGAVAEGYGMGVVALGKVAGKFARQQENVVAAFAQRGHIDLNRRQAIVEVLAEAPFGDGPGHVDIGGGDDAHVALLDVARPDTDKLAGLKHAQQARLCGQRQLGHFVEENSASVGFFEISLRAATAPVNAPFSWPKSSLSIVPSGMAPQLTAM